MSPPPWSPPALGRRGARGGEGTAHKGVCRIGGASLTSPAHPVQTCTSGDQASLGTAPPRPDSECLRLPGLNSIEPLRLRILRLAANMRWAWVAATVLLWPQLTFLGGNGARREPKRPRQSSQRSIAPNATTLGSEGLLGFPKVCMICYGPTWAIL